MPKQNLARHEEEATNAQAHAEAPKLRSQPAPEEAPAAPNAARSTSPKKARDDVPTEFPRPRRLDLSGYSTPSERARAKRRAAVGLVLRFGLLFVGMFFSALGIAFVTTAEIGTTPISTVPLVAAEITHTTFGTATFFVNLLFVAAQFALLRRKCPIWNLTQVAAVFFFSIFIDFSMGLLANYHPSNYFFGLCGSLLGNVFLALGILMQVRSKTLVQPGEGMVLALAVFFRKPFGNMKIINDCSLVAIAALVGLVFLGAPYQIREGTLISAVLVGLLVKLFDRIRRRITGAK